MDNVGLYRDNGKEHGNYYVFFMSHEDCFLEGFNKAIYHLQTCDTIWYPII